MKCIICNSGMAFYFSKDFKVFNLGKVDYWKCSFCGFTISKTHADMTVGEWETLNYEYHKSYQGKDFNPDDERWVARLQSQATVLSDAVHLGILKGKGQWLDYACGDGKLTDLLDKEDIALQKYDKYLSQKDDYLEESKLTPKGFDFVITTSVFEHFTLREQFDSVEKLVSSKGVLGLHTLVSETTPNDASWFYLLPVHCAFHTNKSMSLLFKQWGYVASIYNVEARLWLWFKQKGQIEELVAGANRRRTKPFYIYKDGFVDYWK